MARPKWRKTAELRAHLKAQAFWKQKGACYWCKTPMSNRWKDRKSAMACTLEHLIPRHAGGPDTYENCVAACKQCNEERGGAFTPPLSAQYAPKART